MMKVPAQRKWVQVGYLDTFWIKR